MEHYQPSQSYLRVATACPEVAVSDVATNLKHITHLYKDAAAQHTALVVFPEMSITGYTLGDLVNQRVLLERAKAGLSTLATQTAFHTTAMVVGLPLEVGNNLYNCAAVLADGAIKGIVPKQHLPTYGEFYEDRWFQSWQSDNTALSIKGEAVPFGTDLLFDINGVRMGVEICEDLWVSSPPSARLAEHGALIIANPSASPEQIGKDEYRQNLVSQQSGRLIAAYLYAGCDVSESTMDIVMGGHQLIGTNGELVAERPPFGNDRLLVTDIDIDHLQHDRRRKGFANRIGMLIVPTGVTRTQTDLRGTLDPNPFLPHESAESRQQRLERALQIQAQGLAQRMKNSRQERVVLGLSGGLDSALALFVACEAAQILGKKPGDILHTIGMPGPASSSHTQSTAQQLARSVGAKHKIIPIDQLVKSELSALGHNGTTQDITYENVQARARTSILFNYANQNGCMVLGTGDMSEEALGWCTYNGDQMSHYNVNTSVPKTMVRSLVGYAAYRYPRTRDPVQVILGAVISPELTKQDDDKISQATEDIIGPYELHDFFMSYQLRWGDHPAKIAYLARQAFEGIYTPAEIDQWSLVYFTRFAHNQFKRSVMPDGPKVGSVALSPRGDWRMPSDLPNAAVWQEPGV